VPTAGGISFVIVTARVSWVGALAEIRHGGLNTGFINPAYRALLCIDEAEITWCFSKGIGRFFSIITKCE
jgi:hypothetical protein